MKEDVIEFLLNVKAIRLHPLTKQSGELFLEVEGEGCVYAADIKPSMDFEVVNPELYLATLDSSEARLYAEFNVELGKGYVPAGSRDGLPIGAIPMDAIFTPIRKVNYAIEPTHIGRQAGYERLTLEVWTDGTVLPLEAVSQAAQILIEQFSPFAAAAKPPQKETKKEHPTISPEQYNIPIEQFGFSPRTVNRLRRNGITKFGELVEKTDKEFLSLKELGPKSLKEVQQQLKELGLTLATEAMGAIEEAKGEEEIEGEEEEKL
jgi:DNA-directed RNA polymerase subunit alpha